MANNGSCVYCKAQPDEYERTICVECGAIWHEVCLDILSDGLGFDDSEDGCPICNYNPFDHRGHRRFHQHEPQQQAEDEDNDDDDGDLGGSRPVNIHNHLMMLTSLIDIEGNLALTEAERARRRQELVSGNAIRIPNEETETDEDEDNDREQKREEKLLTAAAAAAAVDVALAVEVAEVAAVISDPDPLDNQYKCSICLRILERPVSVL